MIRQRRKDFSKRAFEPEASTPEELKAFVVSEIRKWAEIVKAAGIRPE